MKELTLNQLATHSITDVEMNKVLGGGDCYKYCFDEEGYLISVEEIPCPE